MRQGLRSHLTYANVMATIAVFIAISGGTAVALNGTDTVQSDDLGPGAQVMAPDVADNAVNSADVTNESLTGADIKNKSGVDSCVNTVRIGNLCFRSENLHRVWDEALQHCANLDLRLPTLAEGLELAKTHDLPGVGEFEFFWTGDHWVMDGKFSADTVSDQGGAGFTRTNSGLTNETVCVTTPTN